MSLPTVVNQVWRLVRVGGVAALAATQGATKVASGDHKALIIAAAIAGVEAIYRQAVPAKEQSSLEVWYKAVKAIAANPALAASVKAVEAEVPAKLVAEVKTPVLDVDKEIKSIQAANAALIDPTKAS